MAAAAIGAMKVAMKVTGKMSVMVMTRAVLGQGLESDQPQSQAA